MPVYLYRVLDRRGKEQGGVITAAGEREAARNLREQGFIVLSVREYSSLKRFKRSMPFGQLTPEAKGVKKGFFRLPLFSSRAKTRDLMIFCRQFASMLEAGITVLSALRVLAEQLESPMLREKVAQVAAKVEEGYSLAASLQMQGDFFPSLLNSMVEAGEEGGVLETVLERLAVHFEKQHELEQKVKAATAYPKFVLSAAVGAVLFMVLMVFPNFADIFLSVGVELPFLTRALIALGEGLISYWYLLALVLVIAYLSLKKILRTEAGIAFYDRFRLFLPVVGGLYRHILVARFCRTLGTLLASGLGLLKALELAKKVVENTVVREIIDKAMRGVTEGKALAELLAAGGFFPAMIIEMVSVGEQTGKLDEMLLKAAAFFETEVSFAVDRLSSLLEPALIIVVAGLVALIAISTLLPMLEVYQMF